mmetsp:Transcript_4187/g.17707  ORF Transcript_4187/g.17707 Transcript_4187/m.17707 type:complete len:216 (+) Transcript_4187:2750-3397(+)
MVVVRAGLGGHCGERGGVRVSSSSAGVVRWSGGRGGGGRLERMGGNHRRRRAHRRRHVNPMGRHLHLVAAPSHVVAVAGGPHHAWHRGRARSAHGRGGPGVLPVHVDGEAVVHAGCAGVHRIGQVRMRHLRALGHVASAVREGARRHAPHVAHLPQMRMSAGVAGKHAWDGGRLRDDGHHPGPASSSWARCAPAPHGVVAEACSRKLRWFVEGVR